MDHIRCFFQVGLNETPLAQMSDYINIKLIIFYAIVFGMTHYLLLLIWKILPEKWVNEVFTYNGQKCKINGVPAATIIISKGSPIRQ